MHKVLVVAAREYNAAVRTRSFVISLVLLPLIMAGSVLIQFLVKDQVDTRDKRFAVIDRTSEQKLVAAIEAAAKARNESEAIHDKATGKLTGAPFIIERVPPSADSAAPKDQQRFELSERVRKQELFGFLEIGADVVAYGTAAAPDAAPTSERRRRPRPTGVADHLALRYQSNTPTYQAFSNWAESVVNSVVQEMRYAKAGLPKDRVKALRQPVPVLAKS